MDSSGEKNDGKGLPWTEEAKVGILYVAAVLNLCQQSVLLTLVFFFLVQFQFLIRIVAQLRENGRTINWQKINMPGRTVKSMQNMWTKINKMIAEAEQETGETPILRPTRMLPYSRLPCCLYGMGCANSNNNSP
jgi:hypothetical protein